MIRKTRMKFPETKEKILEEFNAKARHQEYRKIPRPLERRRPGFAGFNRCEKTSGQVEKGFDEMITHEVKHHRKSLRLKDYDYSQNGYYFVTICTKDGKEYFGKIKDNEMILNRVGETAKKKWLEIPEHFEDVRLDEHVIMPNHVHGIVIIDSEDPVGNRHACSLQGRQYQKLPVVIGSYKSAVTHELNQMQNKLHFKWQKSFYDHIIRNDKSLDRIRKYIRYNPLKWEYDQENQNEIPAEQKKTFWKAFLMVKAKNQFG